MPRKVEDGRGASGLTLLQEEFAAWLLTTHRERKVWSLPDTQNEWAEWKGVTDRTVRRWKQLPGFQAYLEQLRIRKAQALTPGSTITAEDIGGARAATDARTRGRLEPPPVAGPDDDPATVPDPRHRDYLRARQSLMALVEGGDRDAIKTFMQLYGADFIAAEKAGAERLVDLTDEQLIDELIQVLGIDAIAERMATRVAGG